jgi:hypothetical protein
MVGKLLGCIASAMVGPFPFNSAGKINSVLIPAELKLTYLKRPYIVTLGTYHMALLLPFNSSATISFRDFVDITRLSEADLTKHLQVLIDAKIITFNVSFTSHVKPNFPFSTLPEFECFKRQCILPQYGVQQQTHQVQNCGSCAQGTATGSGFIKVEFHLILLRFLFRR